MSVFFLQYSAYQEEVKFTWLLYFTLANVFKRLFPGSELRFGVRMPRVCLQRFNDGVHLVSYLKLVLRLESSPGLAHALPVLCALYP